MSAGDFGLSRVSGGEEHTEEDRLAMTAGCGTPFYMSPEQLSSRSYSYPSDLWALGCVLFELLTLSRAFNSPSYPALLMAVIQWDGSGERAVEHKALLSKTAASDPSLPPSLLALPTFGALLNRDPAKRATLRDVAAALTPHLPPPSLRALEVHSQVCDADTTTDRQTVKRYIHNGSARSRSQPASVTPTC